jgi:hypothetical protein
MKEIKGKKILMINNWEGGAYIAFKDMCSNHQKDNQVDFFDIHKYTIIPKQIRYIMVRTFVPFYSLLLQIIKDYDVVIMNGNIVFPFGMNSKCEYYNIIFHPLRCTNNFNEKKLNFFGKILLLHERISIYFCKNILTDSKFAQKLILNQYPEVNCEIIEMPINDVFYKINKKHNEKINAIFLPIIYREERKGGNFITPILIKLSNKLKEKNIQIIISNRIHKSQQKNYEELCKHCEVINKGNITYEELAELYASSLVVLTPATMEGYGLIPLEVKASGGNCISAPFPSLGFDNISVDNNDKKTIVNEIIVLEHVSKLWEKEIEKIIEKV